MKKLAEVKSDSPPSHFFFSQTRQNNRVADPTDVAFKIGSQIMREKVAIGKTL